MNTWAQGEALSMFVLSVLNRTSNKGVLEGFLIVLSLKRPEMATHRYKVVSNAHYKLHVYSISGMSTALVITLCFVPSLEGMTINRWPMERGCNSLARG